MVLEFAGEIWYWKGPAPHHFVSVPPTEAKEIAAISSRVTYGWGMIPVKLQVNGTETRTALWPKDGGYIVPIRANVRKIHGVSEGDVVSIRLEIELGT